MVRTGSGSVEVTDNVSHTGLVTHDGGEVNGLLGVVLFQSIMSTPVVFLPRPSILLFLVSGLPPPSSIPSIHCPPQHHIILELKPN